MIKVIAGPGRRSKIILLDHTVGALLLLLGTLLRLSAIAIIVEVQLVMARLLLLLIIGVVAIFGIVPIVKLVFIQYFLFSVGVEPGAALVLLVR